MTTVARAASRTTERGASCRHCGLPVPRGAATPGFCCNGCATVFRVIHEGGLERYYELGGGAGAPVGDIAPSRARDWLDACRTSAVHGVTQVEADVQGIHCAACVWLLQQLWRRRDGALDLDLNPSLGRLRLVYDAERLDVGDYFDACESLGYRIGPPGKGEAGDERELLVRLGVCVALALNAMVFALGEYFGMSEADGPAFGLFRWLSLGLATLSVAVGGPVFFRAALGGLRRRVLHLDLPIALGIALGYGSSLVAFVGGFGGSYFDTVTVFVALMLTGRYLQQRAVRRNRDFLLANDGTQHVKVRRISDDGVGIERVPVASVLPGHRLVLAPGDLVPVKALLEDAVAAFSLDWINGESEPRRFERGAELPAGAFVSGRRGVVVAALATAAESGLDRLLATPAEGRDESARASFWAALNRVWVAGVLLVAAAGGLAWAWIDPSRAVSVVTSVLIVTCPCAIGIALPLAFDLSLARLRRRGVFVRRASLLDRARHVRKIVFDKTGTLTWGGARVEELRPVAAEHRDVLFTLAAANNHPVSRAIADDLGPRGARFLPELRVEDVPGRGVHATVDGREYRLGSPEFTLGCSDGGPLSVFTCDGHVESCYRVDEDFRAGAAEELAALDADGYELWLASGDRPEKVTRAVERLGFESARARGGLSPQRKADLVRSIDRLDTLMVGDGLNDAPAFAEALCAGTPALDRPVMPGRADFFYTGAGVGAVSAVLDASRRLWRVVVTDLWLAGIYNAGALALCLAGLMEPWLVAILMPASSLVLIAATTAGIRAGTPEVPR